LPDIEERFEPAGFETNLFVQPGILDDVGGESGEIVEQLFVRIVKSIQAIGIDIEDAATLPGDFEGDREFGKNIFTGENVTGIIANIANAGGFASLRDPARDAFAEAKFEAGGVGGRPTEA
jgi:hypothetical protein